MTSNQVSISLTTKQSDFDQCAKMMSSSHPWIQLGLNENDCRNAFNGTEREIYTLKEDGIIIGFLIIQPKGSFKGYIQTLCIDENYRGKGYGWQLLTFAEQLIHQYSPNVFICVSDFNKRALELYLKFGFEQVGLLPNFVKNGFTEILLRKTIGPIIHYQPK